MISLKLHYKLFGIITAIALLLLGVVIYFALSKSNEPQKKLDQYRNQSLDVIVAHLARLEKADAKSVYLADKEALRYYKYFERAGLSCVTNEVDGQFKLILFASPKASTNWKKAINKLSSDGALAWVLDVSNMTAKDFRDCLTSFPCAATRLWMPSEKEWLLTGHREKCALKLDVLLDAISFGNSADDLSSAMCDSLAELYANYVGLREDILPAFVGDLSALVMPEFFIPQDVPSFDWLLSGDIDEDIERAIRRDIRSFQIIRRKIIKGNLLALEKGGIDKAIETWALALSQNPHDTLMLDRLYHLAINAKAFEKIGNIKGAAKCYETMISIRPKDAAAMMHYAACMRQLGQKEIANAAEKRASELREEVSKKSLNRLPITFDFPAQF